MAYTLMAYTVHWKGTFLHRGLNYFYSGLTGRVPCTDELISD